MDECPVADLRHPKATASDEAIAVLLAMARWGRPISHGQLQLATGVKPRALSYALQGLKARGRILAHGHGVDCLWRLAAHRGDPR